MKKLLFVLVLWLPIFSFTGCNSNQDSPESVCERFIEHWQALEIEEASKLCTDETKIALETVEAIALEVGMSPQYPEIEIIECKVKSKKAVCQVLVDGTPDTYYLVKENGKWLVHLVEVESN